MVNSEAMKPTLLVIQLFLYCLTNKIQYDECRCFGFSLP